MLLWDQNFHKQLDFSNTFARVNISFKNWKIIYLRKQTQNLNPNFSFTLWNLCPLFFSMLSLLAWGLQENFATTVQLLLIQLLAFYHTLFAYRIQTEKQMKAHISWLPSLHLPTPHTRKACIQALQEIQEIPKKFL